MITGAGYAPQQHGDGGRVFAGGRAVHPADRPESQPDRGASGSVAGAAGNAADARPVVQPTAHFAQERVGRQRDRYAQSGAQSPEHFTCRLPHHHILHARPPRPLSQSSISKLIPNSFFFLFCYSILFFLSIFFDPHLIIYDEFH